MYMKLKEEKINLSLEATVTIREYEGIDYHKVYIDIGDDYCILNIRNENLDIPFNPMIEQALGVSTYEQIVEKFKIAELLHDEVI